MRDPEPLECCICLRYLQTPSLWVCNSCIAVAEGLGLEVSPFHPPGDEAMSKISTALKERRDASTS